MNRFNTLIIGSGLAGLNLARKLAQAGQKVFLASKEAITEGSSKYAQGGIAVCSPLNPEDDIESHVQDTINSGAGLSRPDVVREILSNAWSKVEGLIKLGVKFDEDFNIEGSHSYKRILHVADATGRAIIKPLIDNVSKNQNIFISQGTEAVSLLKSSNERIVGASFRTVSGHRFEILAENTVLASGGFGGLFAESTTPKILTGDGIALAYDAGAKLENLEFVQFHPTVFKQFLISEAARGAGAILRNINGESFAHKYHPNAELATRDIVSRAIVKEMKDSGADFVYMDFKAIPEQVLFSKFPTIYRTCKINAYDLREDLLPVRPAVHYSIGGIKVDINGSTNIPGLFAVGEVASNGLHGANRLASNSLLEALVCSEFLADEILRREAQGDKANLDEVFEYCSDYEFPENQEEYIFHGTILNKIKRIMSESLGIERKHGKILTAMKELEEFPHYKERTVASLVAKSALIRKESRGAHFRSDYPKKCKSYEKATILSKNSYLKVI
jgi:L-aspartate oxidase